jgi:SAM-dependent methyltransferase
MKDDFTANYRGHRMTLPYKDFYYPLNVFAHILTLEEGAIGDLHYGLFERAGEPIALAQMRSTDLLLSRLPSPPARLLDVGCGLGTTLRRLIALGCDAEGIAADDKQAAFTRGLPVHQTRFEDFASDRPYDAIFFQESSQYIESDALFARAKALTRRVIVLDEFAVSPVGALHRYDDFVRAAAAHGFGIVEEIDVSQQAAPTIDYFLARLPRYRETLLRDLALTSQHIDDLIRGGGEYRENYRSGAYVYRLLQLQRKPVENR